MVLFFSAFCSFVITEYQKFNKEILFFLFIGFFVSYIANLFRMAIIVVVGIHTNPETMFWVHSNLGWIIFLLWIGLFWPVFTKYMDATHIDASE